MDILRHKWSHLIIGPGAATCAALLWIGLIETKLSVRDRAEATRALILANDRLIQSHVRAWGEAPISLNELRLFARQTSNRYVAFDAWGERLEYIRLGTLNYTIRSFGEDGAQNKPGETVDPGVFRWGDLVDRGLRYDDQAGATRPRPSIVLFAGADDSSGRWHARLFADPLSGVKRLMVRGREYQDFYMLAPHDGIEEFLWVPGEEKIVFTASQSARYADGVYLWDLKTDVATNLLAIDPEHSGMDPGTRQRNFYLALSSVRGSNPPSVAVFVAPVGGGPLDPHKFFHPDQLHVFELGEKLTRVPLEPDNRERASLHDLEFLGTSTVLPGGEGSPLQKAWQRLPMGGDWEKAVTVWQEFASRHGKSQLAPYAVWGLAMFYSEAAREEGPESKAGQVLTGYSIELGNALSQMVMAPGYVQAIGAWMAGRS